MQARLFVLLVTIASASCRRAETPTTVAPTERTQAPHARRAIVVSIDGLMPDAYLNPDRYGLKVPTLRQMVATGAHAQFANTVMPAVTYPAHTTIATGVAPSQHGIVSNRQLDPTERNQDGWRWYTEDIKVPTLWDVAAATGRATALINWPVTVGAKATFLVPEYWRAGTAEDQKLLRAMATPGLLDAVQARFPDLWTKLTPPDTADEAGADIAVHLIETAAPELTMLHIWMVDEMQHRHGPWSPPALAAIEEADRQLQRIIVACQRAGTWDDTVLLVVSDHGFARSATRTLVKPGVLLAERGLIERGPDGKISSWKATVQANGGTAYVYLARPSDPATATAVRAALAPLTTGKDAAVSRIIAGEDLAAMGGDPEALFALEAAEGISFADGTSGPLRTPASSPGQHGWPPDQAAMRASFLAFGPAVVPADLGGLRLVDVAPTTARWLGFDLPSASSPGLDLRGGRGTGATEATPTAAGQ
jgi:Type I phosphodiesterase / nucleotide pyrophosphatase